MWFKNGPKTLAEHKKPVHVDRGDKVLGIAFYLKQFTIKQPRTWRTYEYPDLRPVDVQDIIAQAGCTTVEAVEHAMKSDCICSVCQVLRAAAEFADDETYNVQIANRITHRHEEPGVYGKRVCGEVRLTWDRDHWPRYVTRFGTDEPGPPPDLPEC